MGKPNFCVVSPVSKTKKVDSRVFSAVSKLKKPDFCVFRAVSNSKNQIFAYFETFWDVSKSEKTDCFVFRDILGRPVPVRAGSSSSRFWFRPVPVQQVHFLRAVRLVRFKNGSLSGSRFGSRAS